MDIGSSIDDYVGADSLNNVCFGYNGVSIDEASTGSLGYGNSPPSQAVMFLNHPAAQHTYYKNNTSPLDGEPENVNDFYNYMHGMFKDGSDRPVDFDFSGSVCDNSGLTETNAGYLPGDRRAVMSSSSLTLNAGDYVCFDYAYYTVVDSNADNFQNACKVSDYADDVLNFYNLHMPASCNLIMAVDEQESIASSLRLYPNPAHEVISLMSPGAANELLKVQVFDACGKLVLTQNMRADGAGRTTLQVSTLTPGLYLLNCKSGETQSSTRFVIN
jgi:hypothetical protein